MENPTEAKGYNGDTFLFEYTRRHIDKLSDDLTADDPRVSASFSSLTELLDQHGGRRDTSQIAIPRSQVTKPDGKVFKAYDAICGGVGGFVFDFLGDVTGKNVLRMIAQQNRQALLEKAGLAPRQNQETGNKKRFPSDVLAESMRNVDLKESLYLKGARAV